MTLLENLISQQTIYRLGLTLLHFLWQGAAVAILLAVLLRVLRKSSANLRYVIACIALALVVLAPAVTFRLVSVPNTTPDIESVPIVPLTDQPRELYSTDIPLQRAAEYICRCLCPGRSESATSAHPPCPT